MYYHECFIVRGSRVDFHEGLAEFHKYKVLVRVKPCDFTYDWVLKMDYKLSILKGN